MQYFDPARPHWLGRGVETYMLLVALIKAGARLNPTRPILLDFRDWREIAFTSPLCTIKLSTGSRFCLACRPSRVRLRIRMTYRLGAEARGRRRLELPESARSDCPTTTTISQARNSYPLIHRSDQSLPIMPIGTMAEKMNQQQKVRLARAIALLGPAPRP